MDFVQCNLVILQQICNLSKYHHRLKLQSSGCRDRVWDDLVLSIQGVVFEISGVRMAYGYDVRIFLPCFAVCRPCYVSSMIWRFVHIDVNIYLLV
jgi:hypothetical protein